MKKIISLVIAFTLILSSFPFALTFGAEYKTPDNFDEMTGLLKVLNVIDDNFELSERQITRGEFVSLIIKASGFSKYMNEKVLNTPFSDVATDNVYAPFIEIAKQRKLALGYSDGTFKPQENVTMSEAVVYMIRLLGYNVYAEANGGYPTGHFITASDIGLLKDITLGMDSLITAQTAVNLIFNALNTKVLTTKSVYIGENKIEPFEGNLLMYESFGINKAEGIMYETSLSALAGPNELPPYSILVGNVQIDVGELNPRYLLGYDVNAYYETETKNVLKFIYENKSDKEIIDINDIDDISDYSVWVVGENGKKVKYPYERGISIIYNGVSTGTPFNMSMLKDKSGNNLYGNIELLDNDNNGKADVIFINVYDEYITGKKENNGTILRDKNDPSKKIKLDTVVNNPYTIIFDENGEELKFSKIPENSSVLVQKSLPDAYQGYIRVYVSVETIDGVLTQVSDAEGRYEITVGKETYKLSPYAKKYFTNALMGKNVTLTFNKFGDVAFVTSSIPSGEQYGMLRKIKVPENESQQAGFYMVNDLGTEVFIPAAKKIKLDARETAFDFENTNEINTFKNIINVAATKTDSYTTGSDSYNTVIRYRLNSNGELMTLDTVLNSEGSLATRSDLKENDTLYMENVTDVLCTRTGDFFVLRLKTVINRNAKCFLYPANQGDEYAVALCNDVFTNGKKYTCVGYYSKKDSLSPEIMAMAGSNAAAFDATDETYLSMVSRITDSVDKDGNQVKKLYVYSENAEKSFLCDSSLVAEGEKNIKITELKQGDIISFAVNSVTGKFTSFMLYYSITDNKVYNNKNTIQGNQIVHQAYPYISNDVGISYVQFADCESSRTKVEEAYLNGKFTTTQYCEGVYFTVYDFNENSGRRIYAGAKNDILSYLESEDECSEIIVHSYSDGYRRPRQIYIIRRVSQ